MRFTWLTLLFLVISVASAQKPVSYKVLKDENSINFYEVCRVEETHFDTINKLAKGSDCKGSQRWENANESKYYPDCIRSQIDPYIVIGIESIDLWTWN